MLTTKLDSLQPTIPERSPKLLLYFRLFAAELPSKDFLSLRLIHFL